MAIEQTVRRRVVEEIEILFYSHDELIVRYKGTNLLFHCWYVRHRKTTFRVFRKALMYQKELTIGQIFQLASKNNVQHTYSCYGNSRVKAAIEKGTVIELSSKGRTANR